MRMKFKEAIKKLREKEDRYHFFFCDQDSKGKPVVFADTGKIDLKKDEEVLEVLRTAKSKSHISGFMTLAGATLHLKPNGSTVTASRIQKGVAVAARDAGLHDLTVEVGAAEPEGLRAKEKGSEFADENTSRSFRATDSADRGKTDFVTEYAADPDASRAKVEGGQLKDAGGTAVDGKKGFVIDPKTGHVHLFDQKVEVENIKTKDRRPATKADLPPNKLPPEERIVATHHSTPLAGAAVAGAGEIEVEKGVVKKIADQSGHYKPEGDLTHQSVRALKDQGAKLTDDKLVGEGGFGGRAATPEEAKEHAELAAYRSKIGLAPNASLGDRLRNLLKEKKRDDELEKMVALEVKLRKAGVGPSQKQAQVELGGKGVTEEEFDLVKGDRNKINALMRKKYGVKEALWDGIDTALLSNLLKLNNALREHMAKVTLGAETFLETGGNEKQIRHKQELGASLKELITPKLWDTIKGDRDKINEELRKRIGRADFLPKETPQKTLDNLTLINLLISKGMAAVAKAAAGNAAADAGQKGKGGTPKPKTAVDQLVDELGLKFEGEVDKGMPADYGYNSIEDVADTAQKLGISASTLQGWIGNDTVMNIEDLAGQVNLTVAQVYEKITGKKA